jgi:phenylacetyl-CoA:acceptor oxidoreductase 27-kDa subunit
MTRWGMVIDLKSCVTCYACMLACKQEHFLPPGVFWNRLLVKEQGKYPNVRKVGYSVLCNHCEKAPCVDACPTGATSKRADGIVVVDSDECVGCGSCVIACPYQQRTLVEEITEYFDGQGLTEMETIGQTVYPHKAGTVVKCVFCAERIDEGLSKGLQPGNDRDATPACVNICMTKARTFGDLDDPNSEVSLIIKERNGKPLLADEGTNPSVYYVD